MNEHVSYLRATVCELPCVSVRGGYWSALADHLRKARSDLLVLPEMPFWSWLARSSTFDPTRWSAAAAAHDEWLTRLPELGVDAVASTRPVDRRGRRHNEAFLWSAQRGYRALHAKTRLPSEDGFWEAAWFDAGPECAPVRVDHKGAVIAALVCSELWYFERARSAGLAGTHLLVTPRATTASWTDRWVVAGRAAAICSGAFSLSSNRADEFGGCGWIIDPDGAIMARTCPEEPFVTEGIDLRRAERAKTRYPRNLVGPGVD